jgi:hypothetical protein
MSSTREPVVKMDVTGDYVRSYIANTETSSRRSYSDRQRGGARKERFAVGGEVLGKARHGEGYVWTWRRQDKAAGQMPVRSVSTPRPYKELGGAPTAPHRCTVRWGAKSECGACAPEATGMRGDGR